MDTKGVNVKKVTFQQEAREGLKTGVDLISNAVKATLGPKGRNVVYGNHYGYPIATKDGVTVARQVEAVDPVEQLGVLLVRQASQKTADDAGDGTTTACVVTQAIYDRGLESIDEEGINPVLLKKGIDSAIVQVVEFVEKRSVNINDDKDIENVATVSANNDRAIGKIIAKAISKVGKEGVITIEDNYSSPETFIDVVEGMTINEGMMSPYFVTNPVKPEAFYENPYILILDDTLNSVSDIDKIVQMSIGEKQRPLVVICHGVGENTMRSICHARVKDRMPILVCKAPQFAQYRTECLIDLAILTGGEVVGGQSPVPIDKVELSDLGECANIRATKHATTIVGGKGEEGDLAKRIKELEEVIDSASSDYEREKTQERLAKLTMGVAVIKVGAPTEVEQKERKARVDDALHATKAAIDEGIVPGGGIMLYRASMALETPKNGTLDEVTGYDIVREAIKSPLRQIGSNSGIETMDIEEYIKVSPDSLNGYNFLTEEYGNLIEMGVIDPTKVVIMALKNGASVAGMLLTTEVCIVETEELEYARTPKPKSE